MFGLVAGRDRGYRDLVDQVSEFVAKRTGESEGALVLLKRANQLDFDENIEMIRLLGKAARLLSKKENADDLVHAQTLLAVAYQSAGLLWAARASCTSAVVTLFIAADEGNELPTTLFPTLMNAAWLAVELKHFPEVLEIVQVARGCLNSLPFDDESAKRAVEQLENFDMVLACQLANLSMYEVPQLEMIPDILLRLDLYHSRFTLLYMLGHYDMLREEGCISESESAQDVESFFNRLAGQPASETRWRPVIFNGQNDQTLSTSVLGVQVDVTHGPTDTGITVAEAIVGTVEAFFATAFELDSFAHVERFDVAVVEANITRFEIKTDIDRMRATVHWPVGVFPGSPSIYRDFLSMLLEIAATIFSATCCTKNSAEAAARLFEKDAAMDRVAMIGSLCLSRQRIFGGVSRLTAWDKHSPKQYDARPDRPVVNREFPPNIMQTPPINESRDSLGSPRMTDHRNVKVHSVIDAHLWDRAGWKGAAYGIVDPKAPPFLALVFNDREAAATIFERWRDRFGVVDKNEEIHIGIIRRFSAEHPTHYGMVITSKIPANSAESNIAMLVSRSLTMKPSDHVNLNIFLELFKKFGAYFLMPMVQAPGQHPQLIKELYLLKRMLQIKMASEVDPNDLENMFLGPRDLRPR